ncbi:MAG TPA: 3-phosphoglycerate dehydrogenase [Fimbriimonadaceae bacterium]|nr:3-phosphoglycerate dehydrogenase [Fimbriimonadaceae bacterium]
MKVLVADKFEKSGLDGLKALGAEVLSEPDLKDETLEARLAETGAEVLVVRSTKVTAPMIGGSSLSLIIRAGAGYNTIDVKSASEKGVQVSNCPGKNSQAVAELAFGLIIALDRKIADNVAQLREGRWNKKEFSKAKGLHGRTLGLVGMGMIGKDMVPKAKAFGMDVIVYSEHLSDEEAANLEVRKVSLAELASESDIVSVHTSLNDRTRGMLGPEFFNALKPGAYFVNTSRAEVVDQEALLRAIDEKSLVAGLDVFEGEPSGGEGEYDGPLRNHPRVYCTHHIGASTDQAQEAVAAETVRIVSEFMKTGKVPNVVNG